jgi:hypothetical protein
LYALLIPDTKAPLSDTYYISAALIGPNGPVTSPVNAGSFLFNGTTIHATSDMVFGVPPLDTDGDAFDAGDLQKHGIYETYFVQSPGFHFDAAHQSAPYNVADASEDLLGHPGPSGHPGTGMYYKAFAVDTTGLAAGYQIHFDLYSTVTTYHCHRGVCTSDVDANQFAPFSHDAQSSVGKTPVPEPSALLLMGSGLAALGLWRQRKAPTHSN